MGGTRNRFERFPYPVWFIIPFVKALSALGTYVTGPQDFSSRGCKLVMLKTRIRKSVTDGLVRAAARERDRLSFAERFRRWN
jgi:hypothetical protein